MKLPFLKNKQMPRVAANPPEDKLVGGSISDHVMHEFMEASHNKDVKGFRNAMEALVYDWAENQNSKDENG